MSSHSKWRMDQSCHCRLFHNFRHRDHSKSGIPSLSSSQSSSFGRPSPSMSVSMSLGPSSRYREPLSRWRSLSSSRSQFGSISSQSKTPSLSSSTSSQLLIPSLSQSLFLCRTYELRYNSYRSFADLDWLYSTVPILNLVGSCHHVGSSSFRIPSLSKS